VEGRRRVKAFDMASLVTLAMVWAGSAQAEFCVGLHTQSSASLQIADVVGSGPVAFHSRTPVDCKLEDNGCLTGTHVLPGDRVAFVEAADGHVCAEAAVTRGKGHPNGWLDADRAKVIANAGGRPSAWWPGSWRAIDQRIDLWTDKGALWTEAGTLWRGPVSPHFGEFKGVMTVNPDGLSYAGETGCTVKLAAFGEQVVVAVDNGKCGALNVSFAGFYTRHRLGEK